MRKPRLRTVWRSVAAHSGAIVAFLFASTFIMPSSTETAVANGDTRTLHLYHANTHETIDATFRVNGAYDPAVLKQLNWFLRDWRRDEETNMDPRLFDVVWEVYRSAGATDRITVYSGYRSPSTNAMLRRRSRAVAEHSQHMAGKAMDTTMPGMSMEKIREIGMRLQRGGVGYYQTSNFVHLDVGGVRSWPRMSYDQLARLFPDGKTVHIASDGRTLGRYEEARAEIEAGGGAAWAPPAQQSKGFFAWLFGPKDDEDEEEGAQVAAPTPQRGAGRVQLALANRQAQAAAPVASPAASLHEDGDRNFIIEEARRAAGQAPGPVVAAAAPPAQPAPPPQAARPAVEPAKPPVAAQPAAADPIAVASIPIVLPPRRPTALASAAPDVPLPPIRPTLVAALEPPPVPARAAEPVPPPAETRASSAKPADPIGALIGATSAMPTPRPRLPVEITQGFSARRAAAVVPSEVLAYAPTAQIQGLRSAAAKAATDEPALAAPDPGVVSARLDRSNFASLTGAVPTRDVTTQVGLAPTVASLRQSARMVAELFSNELSASGYASRFKAAATDLDESHFTGSATQPLVAQSDVLFATSELRRN